MSLDSAYITTLTISHLFDILTSFFNLNHLSLSQGYFWDLAWWAHKNLVYCPCACSHTPHTFALALTPLAPFTPHTPCTPHTSHTPCTALTHPLHPCAIATIAPSNHCALVCLAHLCHCNPCTHHTLASLVLLAPLCLAPLMPLHPLCLPSHPMHLSHPLCPSTPHIPCTLASFAPLVLLHHLNPCALARHGPLHPSHPCSFMPWWTQSGATTLLPQKFHCMEWSEQSAVQPAFPEVTWAPRCL